MPQAPCILFPTSGTTSEPKLVVHDQRTVVRHARDVAAAWKLTRHSAVCLVPPLCGVYGFCTALAGWAGGAPVWMRPLWDPAAAAEDIRRGHCTHITGSDDAYAQLLAARDEPTPFPSLVFAGFAPFNPALADIVATAEARGLRLSGLYGASEVMALFSMRDPAAPTAERGLTGGFPVDPSARVRARDPIAGAFVTGEALGELEIDAPHSRMVGYYANEEATRSAFTDDGWYRTGDIGRDRGDGSFEFVARAGDSLRLGGFLVNPAEIEEIVQEAPGVKACQVVGVAQPDGTRAIAFVIPVAGQTLDEAALTKHVRSRLAGYKVPVRFFDIDSFPVTVSANATKIRKDALRQIAQQRMKETSS